MTEYFCPSGASMGSIWTWAKGIGPTVEDWHRMSCVLAYGLMLQGMFTSW